MLNLTQVHPSLIDIPHFIGFVASEENMFSLFITGVSKRAQ